MKKLSFIIVTVLLFACNNNNRSAQNNTSIDTNTAILDTGNNNKIVDTNRNDLSNDTGITNPINTTGSDKLIVPGEKIGRAVLNTNADSLEQLFGKPDMSDAAMGKAWLTWYGKKNDEHNNKTQLDIYTAYKDTGMREKSVQQVRTTSSFFNTGNGIHVYSSLNEIQKAFPEIHKVKQNEEDTKKFTVYDAVKDGIAFEIVNVNNQKICTAIFIHFKGKKVMDIYIASPQ